ncbi:alkaline phosphatase PafA [Flagellimonas sp. 2504JD4-2]
MRKITLLLAASLFLAINPATGQRKAKKAPQPQPQPQEIAQSPKLVVGIIVDQMRYDYLTRFWNHYGDGGFKRLINDGFNCKNHHFNYAPTKTGPGHASVYTGTTPATHGIIGNDWYDKILDQEVYCASDNNYKSVGTTSEAGKMSPHRMLTTTMTDQLRLHTQNRGKVIAVALKDRGAVLPGGHTANAAYWFEGGDSGQWISSTYYMQSLPQWVVDFNTSDRVEAYKKPWTTLKDISLYQESGLDNNSYEGLFEDETAPVFPHSTPNLLAKDRDFEILKYTPYGNSITMDFALAALENENLGMDSTTDFLAISFSSTDYVGHKYGVNSKEIQDTYLRLDVDLARLLNQLDAKVGTGEYTVFLTADHGAVHVPSYLRDQKLPAGYLDLDGVRNKFLVYVKYQYGTTDVIKHLSDSQVFLDHKIIANLDMDLKTVQEDIAMELLGYEGINETYTAYQLWQNEYTEGIPHLLQNGWNQKRSGDVLLVKQPGFAHYHSTGSTHGSPLMYDTHVPLLLYGKGIKKGSTVVRTEIPDIAPTIAALLGIAFPNGNTGEPIAEVLD